ncbi:MAG: hypothetical protein ACXABD_19605 [Candidatus Thorarchaeota archaeon]|jgi:hypothetical protein
MKIRIDFSDAGIGDYIHCMNRETMYQFLLGSLTDDECEWKRLSKDVYVLEISQE